MFLEVLLALIVSASVSALRPTGLIETATEGIVGNRADAAFSLVYQHLRKGLPQQASASIQSELRRSLWLSYLRALVSISSLCKAELVGSFPQMYRGQPVYDRAVKAEMRWLDSNLERLKQQIKLAEDKSEPLPDIVLGDVAGFSASGESAIGVALAARGVLERAIAPNAIPLYIEKLRQPKEGLLDKTFEFFVEQLDRDSKLRTFFKTQLLVQIHSDLDEQKATLQDIDSNLKKVSEASQAVPEQIKQVIGKLESADEKSDATLRIVRDVRALMLGSRRGSVEQTDSISPTFGNENLFEKSFDISESRKDVQRQSGVSTLKRLLVTTHGDVLQEMIRDLPFQIDSRVFYFWESFNSVVKNSLFYLYDRDTREVVEDIWKSWDTCLSYGEHFGPLGGSSTLVFGNFQHEPLTEQQEEIIGTINCARRTLDESYRTHLRSFKKYAKMIGAVYLNHNGLLKQSD